MKNGPDRKAIEAAYDWLIADRSVGDVATLEGGENHEESVEDCG